LSKGWDHVEQQAQETAAARQRAQETFLPELKVNANNPGPFIVRFCEQGPDVNSFPVHEYKINVQGNWVVRRFTCLSEVGSECPGCKAGLKRKTRGVYNLIQRNRPVLRKGADGKALKNPDGSWVVDGYQDQVVVANVGGPTAEMLRKVDGDYRGLMSRDFQITFSGDTFQSWTLSPVLDAGGSSNPTPLSENDQALLAHKHDLDKYMAPPKFEEAAQIVARYGQNSGANTTGQPGGVGGPQGTAAATGPANGFLAGAPAGAPVNAFGAAAGLPPQPQPGGVAPPPPPPAPAPAPAPVQPPQPQVQPQPGGVQPPSPPAPPQQPPVPAGAPQQQ
jgi:hypothetical protein